MIEKTAKYLFTIILLWLPLPFIIMLDLLTELYHQICFPIYGIPKVHRADYIEIWDRSRLQYLKPLEKIGCAYCGYANGVTAYFKEIANRTEGHRCAIFHDRVMKGEDHQHKNNFAPYGNQKAYNKIKKENI